MKREDYHEYLNLFNNRDYDGILSYYAPDGDFEITFFGSSLRTREDVKNFYTFFHDHVKEEIFVHEYISTDDMVALEATVRLTGIRDLTVEGAKAAGFDILAPVAAGDVSEISQFAHYHLREGKITSALCALFQPAAS